MNLCYLVYSREEEEPEYLRYFEFLRSKGYIADVQPEIVTLEDLQGVSGLKALRIGINYEGHDLESELEMQEIMDEIETSDKKDRGLVKSN
ncbi:MAG: hypothetical protein KJP00_08155 [Bacteroidia bacterium]|nr:hypothetical protein [Bacteroidia bacterium]